MRPHVLSKVFSSTLRGRPAGTAPPKQLYIRKFDYLIVANKKPPTPQEVALARELKRQGVLVETDKLFWYRAKDGRRRSINPDICIPELNLVVEVDGSHHALNHEQQERDIKRDNTIRQNGWIVQHVSNRDIEKPGQREQFAKSIKKRVDRLSEKQNPRIPREKILRVKKERKYVKKPFSCLKCGRKISHKGNCYSCNIEAKVARKKKARKFREIRNGVILAIVLFLVIFFAINFIREFAIKQENSPSSIKKTACYSLCEAYETEYGRLNNAVSVVTYDNQFCQCDFTKLFFFEKKININREDGSFISFTR